MTQCGWCRSQTEHVHQQQAEQEQCTKTWYKKLFNTIKVLIKKIPLLSFCTLYPLFLQLCWALAVVRIILMKQNSIWTVWEGYCVRLYDEIHRYPLEFAKSKTIICMLRIKPLPWQSVSKTSEGRRGGKRSSHCDTHQLCQSSWKELANAPSMPFIKPVEVRKEAHTKVTDTSVPALVRAGVKNHESTAQLLIAVDGKAG